MSTDRRTSSSRFSASRFVPRITSFSRGAGRSCRGPDPNQTFGVAIEFEGGNPTAIARAMYDAGLASSPRQERYHSGARQPGMWTVETDATVVGASHGVGLNYGNITGRRRTVEYRYFDFSLDPARLQANIQLACWLTRRAAELLDSAIPRDRVRLGSNRAAGDTGPGERLLRRFADLVFVRPQDRLRLYWLFQRSAWQPGTRAA